MLSDEQNKAIAGMKPFYGVQTGDLFIAMTGYTGEKGYEIAMPKNQVVGFWHKLLKAGVHPAGSLAHVIHCV